MRVVLSISALRLLEESIPGNHFHVFSLPVSDEAAQKNRSVEELCAAGAATMNFDGQLVVAPEMRELFERCSRVHRYTLYSVSRGEQQAAFTVFGDADASAERWDQTCTLCSPAQKTQWESFLDRALPACRGAGLAQEETVDTALIARIRTRADAGRLTECGVSKEAAGLLADARLQTACAVMRVQTQLQGGTASAECILANEDATARMEVFYAEDCEWCRLSPVSLREVRQEWAAEWPGPAGPDEGTGTDPNEGPGVGPNGGMFDA